MNIALLGPIRQVARAGDTLRAWRMFVDAGGLLATDPQSSSLKGRLLKDRALKAVGAERAALLDEAEQAYLQSAGVGPATYPLINAATIALLNDKRDQARALAAQTIALIDSGAHEAETAYWLSATRAEAYLLLDRIDGAQAALATAIAHDGEAWEDHAATLRQFRIILERVGQPADWLDRFRPPVSLQISGIIGLKPGDDGAEARIVQAVRDINPGFVFGALAAGADIVAAEAAIALGAQLYVILPASIEAFRRDSVQAFDGNWSNRFDALLDSAEYVEAPAETDRVSEAGIAIANEVAMGMALRKARALESQAIAMRIQRRFDAAPPPGSGDAAWRGQGLQLIEVEVAGERPNVSKPLAILDRAAVVATGTDAAQAGLLAAGGKLLGQSKGHAILRFDTLPAAAAGALAASQDGRLAIDYLVLDDDGLGASTDDPFARVAHIAQTAPPGSVYASEPASHALALHAPDLRCEAIGDIATPLGHLPVTMLFSRIGRIAVH